jgi:hypothetical protein
MFRFLKYFAAAPLRDELGAVYNARTQKSGSAVSQDQLKAARDQMSAKQDDFLKALVAKGVTAAVVARNVRNYDGKVAAAVPLRYTPVFVFESSLGAICSMPQGRFGFGRGRFGNVYGAG